jgi:hypothetical protein
MGLESRWHIARAKHFVGVFGTKMFADTGKMSMSFSEHMKLEQA